MQSIDNGILGRYTQDGGSSFQDLIRLVEDPRMNHIGRNKNLSATWYDKRANAKDLKEISDNLRNFFRNAGVSPREALWTVYKDKLRLIAPHGFSVTQRGIPLSATAIHKADAKTRAEKYCWIPVNMKASNLYRHKTAVAILANYNTFPQIEAFFKHVGFPMDQDRYCLSEMIQVIWRSAIRDGHPIDLYIPSERMRKLFKGWLDKGASVLGQYQNTKKVA
jgi:hypothetical protein